MVDVDKLSDAELRAKLMEFGFPVMPITGTTRKVMAKKLKLLLENKNKLGKDSRRSLGRYSSEDDSEDSDTGKAAAKKDSKFRRITMAAPPMQPPASPSARGITTRKSTRVEVPPPVPEVPLHKEVKTTTTTTKTTRIVQSKDEFDTGSESDEVADGGVDVSPSASYVRPSSSDTNRQSLNSSYTARTASGGTPSPSRLPASFISASTAADVASDRLNQIRSRLSQYNSDYDKPLYSTPPKEVLPDKESTPFLSNFTKRLSQLTETNTSPKASYDYKSDIVKEHDTNGSGSLARTYLNSYRSNKGRPSTRDYKDAGQNISKNNFVSWMVLAVACLFFIAVVLIYCGIRSDSALEGIGAVAPICDSSREQFLNCVLENEAKSAISLLKVLRPELNRRAAINICSDPKVKPYMSESDIATYVSSNVIAKKQDHFNNDLRNLEVMTFLNPSWGISVAQVATDGDKVEPATIAKNMENVNRKRQSLVTVLLVPNPSIPWKCYLYQMGSFMFNILISFVGGVAILYVITYGWRYYKQYKERQREEEVTIVENIIDVLQSNCGENEENNFLVINHVRDMILPIGERKSKEKTWVRAVKYINENESRIRTEVQVVRGEPSEVWRWLGGPGVNATNNKSWQGQAFETQVGSVNSPPCSPTPCLKIRGMMEEGERNTQAIKKAVLGKCAQHCKILHCGVDVASKCVYLKCADTSDAAVAYRDLHGWWYSGNLVTVKYLRLERYMQRFPDSPVNGPPYLK